MSKITLFHPQCLQITLNKWCLGCHYMLMWDTWEVCRHGCYKAGYRHKCPQGVTSCPSSTCPSCLQGLRLFLHSCRVPVGLRSFCLLGYSINQLTDGGPLINHLFDLVFLWKTVMACNTKIVFSRGTLGISTVAGGRLPTGGNWHQMLIQNHCGQ